MGDTYLQILDNDTRRSHTIGTGLSCVAHSFRTHHLVGVIFTPVTKTLDELRGVGNVCVVCYLSAS